MWSITSFVGCRPINQPSVFQVLQISVWSTYVQQQLRESQIELNRYLQKQIIRYIFLDLRAFYLCDFDFKQLKITSLLNMHHFSSHFNTIMRSVIGNMADDSVALKTIEAARSDSIESEIK
jgi:hypothetical protein